ncbi:MAG: hypothetical protein H8E66_10175 [Planctomycetes bacterium]|nr:hypothetical protein [Planctomycetota bacterium]
MRMFQEIKQRWTSHTSLPEIAGEVADQCLEAVWQRVQHQVSTLSTAEARGYIRARGVAVVQPRLASASTEHDVLEQLRPQLYFLTVEAVIGRVQDRLREHARDSRWRHAA